MTTRKFKRVTDGNSRKFRQIDTSFEEIMRVFDGVKPELGKDVQRHLLLIKLIHYTREQIQAFRNTLIGRVNLLKEDK